MADCEYGIGCIEEKRGNIKKALEYYHLALDKYTRLGIQEKINDVDKNISNLEKEMRAFWELS